MLAGAPCNLISSRVCPPFSLPMVAQPPILLPLPGSTCTTVTPPETARAISGSSVLMESSERTCASMSPVISLPSELAFTAGMAYTPRWECGSTRPGSTYSPRALINWALAGTATFAPTAAIFPFSITTVPWGMAPCVMVRIVAPWMTMGRLGADASLAQNALTAARQAHHSRRIVKKRMLFTDCSQKAGNYTKRLAPRYLFLRESRELRLLPAAITDNFFTSIAAMNKLMTVCYRVVLIAIVCVVPLTGFAAGQRVPGNLLNDMQQFVQTPAVPGY